MKPDMPTDAPLPPGGAAAPEARARAAALPVVGWPLWLAWLVAGLALLSVFTLWQKFGAMQEQLARQSQESGKHAIEARTLARQAESEAREAVARMAALDGRVNDLLGYRNQVENLVQTLVRGRDETLLVELETSLRLAQDQAQLTGALQPMLAALRSAERRLNNSTDLRLDGVRRAVAEDLERLRQASVTDTAGLLVRLDRLLADVDSLPLANSVHASMGSVLDPALPEAPDAAWWQRWRHAVRNEAQRLLRVSRIDHPEAALLSPEQAYFVRENLKLRLLSARLALMVRQHDAARADLALAAQLLRQWFDQPARRTRQAAELLQRVQQDSRSAELPRVDVTLLALEQAAAAFAP